MPGIRHCFRIPKNQPKKTAFNKTCTKFSAPKKEVTWYWQPKHCTIYRWKFLQNVPLHICIKFDPKKNGSHLMTPVWNADWFSSMPSSRCSKRALKVPCGPFERRIFWRGNPFFGGSSGVGPRKTNFPVLHTYLHLKGSNKNSSYLFIWGHLQGFIRGETPSVSI